MKSLMKIFMAVVAGMFAFSCVTDTTEDLGVQVGNGANEATIELSLSLEESRTQLGEKVDGLYPLYWSEGDKISVNGVESGEAVINQSNPASATFAVSEAASYAVAYPAAPAGKVLFAEKQSHVAAGNTFASGVSTMYGYSEDVNNIQLNHLTGVLKIGIKGEAVLSKAQISTIDRAPIAGAFDIDFQTGELEATTASKEVIEYSFGEGLQLTSDAQYIHVAVPAGKYDELYITLYEKGNSGNIMYATVKAPSTKPLTAGNVREFKTPIVYVPNAQAFVINSVEQLQAFKTAVEASTTLAIDAIFTEDIDMTGVEWTPINGPKYINTVHGNGYAIKGLTAPLFNQTSATIKGLHLVDVNIETNITNTANRFYGALVCALKPAVTGETNVAVENCSVSGTILINNPKYPTNQNLFLGGVVGAVYGGVVDSCVGRVNITVSKMSVDGKAKSFAVGGVVGLATNSSTLYSAVNNSKNEGVINIQPEEGTIASAYLAGVVAYSQNSNLGINMSNCENSAAISYKGTATTAYIGGVLGDSYGDKTANLKNLSNSGTVTVKSGSTITTVYLAGIAGESKSCNMDTVVNDGEVVIESGAKFKACYAGGVVGVASRNDDVAHTTTNLTNNGAIKLSGECIDATTSTSLRMGGVVGYSQANLTNATNNGDITISGNLSPAVATPEVFKEMKGDCFAGVVGYKTMSYTNNITNTGKITVSANMTSLAANGAKAQVNIGGLVGYTSNDLNTSNETAYTSVSSGDITVSGNTTNCTLCIGGTFGHSYNTQDNETCSADIKISGNHTGDLYVGGVTSATQCSCKNMTFNGSIEVAQGTAIGGQCYVGGIAPYVMSVATDAKDAPQLTDLTNNGTIKVGATTAEGIIPLIAGCVAISEHQTADAANAPFAPVITNMTNTGEVTYSGTPNKANCFVAGCVGRSRGTLTTAENSGTIIFAADAANGSNSYIGGVVAVMNNIVEGAVNSGEVKTIEGATFKTLYMGGVFGNISGLGSSQTYKKCHNSGTISHTATNNDGTGLGTLVMAGISGVANAMGEDSYNTGTIINTGRSGALYMSGCVHNADRATSNCYNTGNIIMSGVATKTYLSGFAYESDSTLSGCYNTGNITLSGTVDQRETASAAGLIYNATGELVNCYNGKKGDTTKGAINFTAESIPTGGVLIGGVAIVSGKSMTGCANYAPINMNGITGGSVYIGGVARQILPGVTWTECVNYGDITLSGVVSSDTIEGSDAGSDAFVGGLCDISGNSDTEAVSLVRCQNHGDITFTETFKSASAVRSAGLYARLENAVPFHIEDCWNSGDVTFNGKGAHRSSGNFHISGAFTSMSKATFTVKGYLINSGAVSIGGDLSNTSGPHIGGLLGYSNINIGLAEGATEALIANTGSVSFTGTSAQTSYVGGVFARIAATIAEGISLVNTGNVTVKNTTAACYVGGVIGSSTKAIPSAKSYCTVNAVGYTGVGMITGASYAAGACEVLAGGVGGTIIRDTIEDNDPSGDLIYLPNPQAITAENYHKHIYGAEVGAEVAAVCSVLAEAPVVTLPAALPVTE